MAACMEMTLAQACAAYGISPENLIELFQALGKVNSDNKEKLIWQATGAATVFAKYEAEERRSDL